MIAPETLLKMHPLDAVRAQIQEQVRAPLKAIHLKIDKPVSLGGLRTQIFATIDKKRAPVELWDRTGGFMFEYDRLDLGNFVQGLDTVLPSQLPTASSDLLRALFSPREIILDDDDVVPAIYTQLGAAEILAAEESYRWVGGVTMTINGQALEITTLVRNKTFTLSFTSNFKSSTVLGDLIMHLNLSNPGLPKAVLASMVTIGLPEQVGADHDGDNTRVMLTFNGFPYVGSFYATYQRRSFPKTFRNALKIAGPALSNTAQLAGPLSGLMGCTITAADIVPELMPTQALNSKQKIAVNFHGNSLAYVGSILVEYNRTV